MTKFEWAGLLYKEQQRRFLSFRKPLCCIATYRRDLANWLYIGCAALYLAHGFDVIVTNPHRSAESKLCENVDTVWDDLTVIGIHPHA